MLADLRANIRRTAHGLVACFAVIAVALGYWQIARPDLSADPANPRVAEERLYQPRGRILDRSGALLASSESTPDGMLRRYQKARWCIPSVSSARASARLTRAV
jgi:cell division protein FtsI/penicillin-binding protein 2